MRSTKLTTTLGSTTPKSTLNNTNEKRQRIPRTPPGATTTSGTAVCKNNNKTWNSLLLGSIAPTLCDRACTPTLTDVAALLREQQAQAARELAQAREDLKQATTLC